MVAILSQGVQFPRDGPRHAGAGEITIRFEDRILRFQRNAKSQLLTKKIGCKQDRPSAYSP